MNAATRKLVRERAGNHCEYCQLHQEFDSFTFHIEHIIAKQHGGGDEPSNLALSCHTCNSFKGPNLSGRIRDTGETVNLYHPRGQKWNRHFRWKGARLMGRTKTGRATITTLNLNAHYRMIQRAILIQGRLFPPDMS